MTSPNTPVDVEAMELAERLLAKPAGVSAYGCQNCDEYLKQDAASALSRLLAERREMLEALKIAAAMIDSMVRHGRPLSATGEAALDTIRAAILSALPEGKGE